MWNRTLVATIVVLALVLGAGSAAASPCHYAVGPEEPVPYGPNPETGLIELTVPLIIGSTAYTVDFEVGLLGALELGDDGLGRRVVVTHTWNIRENGLRLEWTGEAVAVPTGTPDQIYYRLRLDLVSATGRYGAGTVFIEGLFNADGTGDARNVFAKLCTGGR